MSDRVILKLGGSVITNKGADCRVNKTALSGIAAAIAGAPAAQIIVVHGAGSCGHPEAHRYHLDRSAVTGQTEGIYVTHRAVSALNDAVTSALRETGVPALGVHPLHVSVADKGRLVAFESRHLGQMLALGMVPVIHGDVVMDLSRGACIVSGDQTHPVSRGCTEMHPRGTRHRCTGSAGWGACCSGDYSGNCAHTPDRQLVAYRCNRWNEREN